jgi:transketolase
VRQAFVNALVELGAQDERILLLTGDLGFTVLEPFAERYPERFFNVGVAEQNMVGMATGLAEAGFTPYVYSIATFASMRGYEFIRNGPIQHRLPVRVVGVGGGVDYGHNGLSHYAIEDIALMRAQPEMTVVAPADPEQVVTAMSALQQVPGPVYLRLGKASSPVAGLGGRFELGGAQRLRTGNAALIVALGPMAVPALAAAERLDALGIDVTVLVVACVSPPPVDDLLAALAEVPLVITAEAHYVNGGLGSLVAEVIAEAGLSTRLIRAGITQTPNGRTGGADYMLQELGIGEAELVELTCSALNRELDALDPPLRRS